MAMDNLPKLWKIGVVGVEDDFVVGSHHLWAQQIEENLPGSGSATYSKEDGMLLLLLLRELWRIWTAMTYQMMMQYASHCSGNQIGRC
jgi:hypothetical protein